MCIHYMYLKRATLMPAYKCIMLLVYFCMLLVVFTNMYKCINFQLPSYKAYT